MSKSSNRGVLPRGVHLAPHAETCLKNALAALRRGLLVTAWHWTERARAELDALIQGEMPPHREAPDEA